MGLKENPTIDEVKNYYEKFVNYRNPADALKNGRILEIFRFIDDNVANKGYKSALDIGCGAGTNTEYLLRHIPDVTGIDISDERISVAKSNGKAKYMQGDFTEYQGDKVYDLVCVFDCLEHIRPQDRDKFLSNVYKSFKDLVLVTIPEPIHLQSIRDNNPKILQIVDEPIFDEYLDRFTIISKKIKGIYTYYILGKK